MTEAGQYRERRWFALILLCFAQFIVVIDAAIVNVALPSIGEGLGFSQENLAWVVNAYVLTFGGFLLLGGRMADLLGRRRVFIAGLLLVAAASLAAGFSANEGQLIAARAAQGNMVEPARRQAEMLRQADCSVGRDGEAGNGKAIDLVLLQARGFQQL